MGTGNRRLLVVSDPPASSTAGVVSVGWEEFEEKGARFIDKMDCLVLGGPLPPLETTPMAAWAERDGTTIVLLLPLRSKETNNDISHSDSLAHWSMAKPSRDAVRLLAGGIPKVGYVAALPKVTHAMGWTGDLWGSGLRRLAEVVALSIDVDPAAPERAFPLLRPEGWPANKGLLLAGQFQKARFLVVPTNTWLSDQDFQELQEDRGQPSPLTEPTADRSLVKAVRWFHSTALERVRELASSGGFCSCAVKKCLRPTAGDWTLKGVDPATGKGSLTVHGVGGAKLTAMTTCVLEALERAGDKGVTAETLEIEVREAMSNLGRQLKPKSTNRPDDWISQLKRDIEEIHVCRNVIDRVFPPSSPTPGKNRYKYLPSLAVE